MSDPFDVSTAKRVRLTLPWETGFAGLVLARPGTRIFGSTVNLLDPRWDHSFIRAALSNTAQNEDVEVQGEVAEIPVALEGPAFVSVGRTRITVPWTKKVEELRQVAMERWRLIVLENPIGSQLGIQLHEASKLPFPQERADNILQDVFASKATRTLEARAGSLLLFSNWRRSLPLFRGILPFIEEDCYGYLTVLRIGKAPATRGKRFREAIGFSHGLIGAKGAEEVLQSKRCQGAALRSFATKRSHTQRDPLFSRQVEALERGVFEMDDEHDRIMCGNTVGLLHVRGRFSDVYHCQTEPFIDKASSGVSFFEVPVLDTKVSRRDKRRKCMPLVGLARGLTGLPWAEEWLRLRKAHGLDASQGPLMVAITAGGNWTSARLRSQEAMTWIRSLLCKLGVPIVEGQLFGTHSLKCTLLSWMAKAGCLMEHRNLLGYHAAGAAESSLLYARAAYSGPLRALHQLLTHIREKRFSPDDTRSGSWYLEQPAVVTERPEEEDDAEKDWYSMPATNTVDSTSSLLPGIDYDAVSEIECNSSSEEVDPRVKAAVAEASDEVDEDDGFGQACDSSYRCPTCMIGNLTINFIFTCDECDTRGCTHCMPVFNSKGKILCFTCGELSKNSSDTCIDEVSLEPQRDSDSSETDGSESSNSEVENAAIEIAAEAVAEAVVGRRPARNPDDFVVQHKTLKTLHMLRKSDGPVQKLTCGRVLSDKFEVLHVIPLFDWPKCGICYGAKSQ